MAKTQTRSEKPAVPAAPAPAAPAAPATPPKMGEILQRLEATLDGLPAAIGLLGELQDLRAEIRGMKELAANMAEMQDTLGEIGADILHRPVEDKAAREALAIVALLVSQMGSNIFKSDVGAFTAKLQTAVQGMQTARQQESGDVAA